jgi:lysophospholipase L1-like esterase
MNKKTLIILTLLLFAVKSNAQPPAGAVTAKPNIIYYAGGSCKFYDINDNLLLSVDATEAGWSATPAKTAWVVVTPSNGGYYEFPNYTSNAPTCNIPQYLQPFWKSDTVYNELVLLNGVNSTAKLMFNPQTIISVTNYDFSQTFVQNTDYSVTGNVIKQLTAKVSSSVSIIAGKKGNGQPNGLMNTKATSWTCVTYIPNRNNWNGSSMHGYKGDKLPKTMAKLKTGQPITIQAYGMSITAGLNVSGFAGDDKNFTPTKPYMRSYVDLLENALEARFGSVITMINGSCGGKMVAWIDQYCESMVVPNVPDLVILDMGMNDIWGTTSNAQFKASMQSCINKIKTANTNIEFILIGNMLPDVNSQGAPSNGDVLMYGFLTQLKSLEATGVAVFDMTTLSDSIYARKGATHCQSNSLHPNDYLARWYAQGLAELFNDGSSIDKTAKKYYVNSTGNNTDGLSITTAWTSLDKINTKNFNAGDTILFEGGKVFTGNLEFDDNDGNSDSKPMILSTYGTGQATINTSVTNKCGFKATNIKGFHISNLKFTGPGNGTQKDIDGMLFFTTNTSGYLSNIAIKNCEVSGFGYCGIRFYSNWDANVKAGYKDVVIDGCKVHDCRENGIVTFAFDNQNTNFYHHKNFSIRNTEVYNITGYAASTHKGSGIVLSQIDSSIIERCVAYNTGTANTACGGPGGIWVWAANAITIQYCESHHNSSGTSTGCDGLGFDLDGGVTNSIIQYCYAHDNDGAGYLLGNFDGARPWGNNTVHYCISANDARTNNSAVTLFTAPNTTWNGLKLYNNTIYVTPSSKNKYSTFGAFQMTDYGTNMSGVECYNNIFYTTGGLPLVTVPTTFVAQTPKFIGNLYYADNQAFSITYGSKYNSLSVFRSGGTFCEKNGSTNTGLDLNPILNSINKNPLTVFPKPTNSLDAFQFSQMSPCRNAGLDLKTLFGIDMGTRDFWGNTLKNENAYDIGAFEWEIQTSGIYSTDLSRTRIYPNPIGKEDLIIDLPENINSSTQLKLFDISGKLWVEQKLIEGLNQIKTSSLPPGLYFVLINDSNNLKSFKLVKSE